MYLTFDLSCIATRGAQLRARAGVRGACWRTSTKVVDVSLSTVLVDATQAAPAASGARQPLFVKASKP